MQCNCGDTDCFVCGTLQGTYQPKAHWVPLDVYRCEECSEPIFVDKGDDPPDHCHGCSSCADVREMVTAKRDEDFYNRLRILALEMERAPSADCAGLRHEWARRLRALCTV